MKRLVQISEQLAASNPEDIKEIQYGPVTVYWLNRPKQLNTISFAMLNRFVKSCREWNSNEKLKCIISKKESGISYSAGGDFKDFIKHRFEFNFLAVSATYNSYITKQIKIALLDGIVMGGGVGMSQFNQIKIATENTMFAMPEGKVGLITDVGGGYHLSRLRNGIGYYLALTASSVRGEDVYLIGLADFYVESEKLPELEKFLIETIVQNPDISEKEIRQLISKFQSPITSKYELEEDIKKYFTKDSLEEIFKSLAANAKLGSFEEKTLKAMLQVCPMSIQMNFELQKKAKNLGVHDYFELELNMQKKMLDRKDATEGMDAFINKRKPQWIHKSIKEIDPKEIEFLSQIDQRFDLDFINKK